MPFHSSVHVAGLLVTLCAAVTVVVSAQVDTDAQLVARARAIHDRVLTIDTHVDISPVHFTAACNYTSSLTTQVDLPKMKAGGLDSAFFVVYVGQGPLSPEGYADAYAQATAKFDAIHRLTRELAPETIELALSPRDVRRIAASGKRVAIIGIENGYALGTELSRVREFWTRGGRYLSLAHNGHNQLSDSNTGETTGDAPNGGVSALGRAVIAELNRLGVMVDVSHPSRDSILQTVALSKAPVIASHSAVRALANHSRNLDDEQLRAIGKAGGVVQIVAFSAYLRSEPQAQARARAAALNALRREFGITTDAPQGAPCPVAGTSASVVRNDATGLDRLTTAQREAYQQRLAAITAQYPQTPRATVRDLADHIDYAVRLIGIDHVGIASDFDGGGGITGWNDASETFNVTLELVRRGYSEADIAKLWGGNLLRVWEDVERVAAGT